MFIGRLWRRLNLDRVLKSSKRQFLPVTEESVDSFVMEQEHKGTARKTLSDMRTLTQSLKRNKNKEIFMKSPK
jgi:hypothetical protein